MLPEPEMNITGYLFNSLTFQKRFKDFQFRLHIHFRAGIANIPILKRRIKLFPLEFFNYMIVSLSYYQTIM